MIAMLYLERKYMETIFNIDFSDFFLYKKNLNIDTLTSSV